MCLYKYSLWQGSLLGGKQREKEKQEKIMVEEEWKKEKKKGQD